MGKLKNLKSRLGTLPPRLGAAVGDKRAQDRERGVRNAARSLYGTPEWQRLRLATFARDGYVCQRSGVLCIGKYPAPNSPVANHKRPHRGDPKLFFDPDNVETVSKAVHDSLIQAEEQAIPMGVWD
jgi:5-methylcytosine-specific restriction endonuclease McrA